jgi:hypothetical protein
MFFIGLVTLIHPFARELSSGIDGAEFMHQIAVFLHPSFPRHNPLQPVAEK